MHPSKKTHLYDIYSRGPYKVSVSYRSSGADRHLDITFGLQVVESSSLVSVLFRELFSHIPIFRLLVNIFFCYNNKI